MIISSKFVPEQHFHSGICRSEATTFFSANKTRYSEDGFRRHTCTLGHRETLSMSWQSWNFHLRSVALLVDFRSCNFSFQIVTYIEIFLFLFLQLNIHGLTTQTIPSSRRSWWRWVPSIRALRLRFIKSATNMHESHLTCKVEHQTIKCTNYETDHLWRIVNLHCHLSYRQTYETSWHPSRETFCF